MENMELWNKLNRPPKRALKQIAAGRLKGKTDINPQWRYEAMTEQFGACGVGWKYEVINHDVREGYNEQAFVFVDINLFILVDGKWSEPIPGNGGSMLLEWQWNSFKKESEMHHNDEAFKMATTDALGTAMKMLGVAADIYAGLWDGGKYKDANVSPPESKAPPASSSQAPDTQTGDDCGGNPHYDPPSEGSYTEKPTVNEDALKKTIHNDIIKALKSKGLPVNTWLIENYGKGNTEKALSVDDLRTKLAGLSTELPFK